MAVPQQPDVFRVGDVLSGTYTVTALLGEGGMGQVFEAQDQDLNRRVAIKAAWNHARQSLRAEAQALAAIRHPGVAGVYCLGEHDGVSFVVLERIYGKTLHQHLQTRVALGQHLTVPEVVDLMVSLADALAAVHDHGIVHRDIKPANIMLAPGNRVVLMDFGLFLPEQAMATTTELSGTPAYMAPETIQGEGTGALVDAYALGILAFQLLTGVVPFQGESSIEVMRSHLTQPVPDLASYRLDVPQKLAALVYQLLAKAPEERPSDMRSIAFRLLAVRAELKASPPTKFSILIVDDQPDLVRLLKTVLGRALPDVEVRSADDGEAAMRAVQAQPPHVLLLDLHMPKMNGVELCMYLRGTSLADHVTIIGVSAGAQPSDLELLRHLGVTRFVTKGDRLGKRILEHIDEIRAGMSGAPSNRPRRPRNSTRPPPGLHTTARTPSKAPSSRKRPG
jgi:serine/threonine protein kinase